MKSSTPGEVDVQTARTALESGAYLLDVRETAEYAAGHIPGSVLIPLSTLSQRREEIPLECDIYIICKVGGRSFQVAQALASMGYRVYNVTGGCLEWHARGLPFETDDDSEPTVM